MARPIYPHELADPDFQWLISTFRERRSVAFTIEESCLPVILLVGEPSADGVETRDVSASGPILNDHEDGVPAASREE